MENVEEKSGYDKCKKYITKYRRKNKEKLRLYNMEYRKRIREEKMDMELKLREQEKKILDLEKKLEKQ